MKGPLIALFIFFYYGTSVSSFRHHLPRSSSSVRHFSGSPTDNESTESNIPKLPVQGHPYPWKVNAERIQLRNSWWSCPNCHVTVCPVCGLRAYYGKGYGSNKYPAFDVSVENEFPTCESYLNYLRTVGKSDPCDLNK